MTDGGTDDGRAAFILAETSPARAPLVPEILLHLASAITPIWQATEASLAKGGLEPPYWAFAWPGAQALARFVLDDPSQVRGRSVLDFAAGSGLAAIAAALAGAGRVLAAELDPLAAAAVRLNAGLNAGQGSAMVETLAADLLAAPPPRFDVILAGDVCYDARMTARVVPWLRAAAAAGASVLLADPGRAYLPREGIIPLAAYDVPVTRELEDCECRRTVVYRLSGSSAA